MLVSPTPIKNNDTRRAYGNGTGKDVSDRKTIILEYMAKATDNRGRVHDEAMNQTIENVTTNNDAPFDNIPFPFCLDGLTDKSTVDVLRNLMISSTTLHGSLYVSSKGESTILPSVSSALLVVLYALLKIMRSASTELSSLNEALTEALNSIAEVVSKLNIQTRDHVSVSTALNDLQTYLRRTIQIANDAEDLEDDLEKKLNSAMLLVAKSMQTMLDSASIITQATMKAVGSVSTEEQEAVISLSFVSATVSIIVQSVYASIVCVLSPLHVTLPMLNKLLVHQDSTIESIVKDIVPIAAVMGSQSMSIIIGRISMVLSYLLKEINSTLDSIIQSTEEFDCSDSIAHLVNRLSELLGNVTPSIVISVRSIASSLKVLSETSHNMLSMAADQANLVYKSLSKVIGTDTIIVTTLIHLLPSIFDAIKSALDTLVSGLGTEASATLIKFTENVKSSLQNLLSLLNDSVQEKAMIDKVVQDFALNIQYVGSAVTSLTLTVSPVIDNVNIAFIEAVLALPIIYSAVLYVSHWVLSVTASILYSLAGSVSETLTKLTALSSTTFENVSKIVAILSNLPSDNLRDLLRSTLPHFTYLNQLVTSSYISITGKSLNIRFNIDQTLTEGDVSKKAENSIASANGTVPEILKSLSGRLGSIPSELSSASFDLKESLKIRSSSGSSAGKVISNILLLILTEVSKVSGSSSEIFSLMSDALSGPFKHLSDVISKFSVLGDVGASLKVSVTSIHKALLSLISSVKDCSADFSNVVDPTRNVAKTTQILISTFSATFEAVSQLSEDVVKNLSDAIGNLTYIVSTIVLIVQYALGATITKLLITFGTLPTVLEQLVLALSTILQRITSIAANFISAESETDNDQIDIINKMLLPVSDFSNLASSSLSVISLVLANTKVSLGKS